MTLTRPWRSVQGLLATLPAVRGSSAWSRFPCRSAPHSIPPAGTAEVRVGRSTQSKPRNHSISGLRWVSGTPYPVHFLGFPSPTPSGSASFTAVPRAPFPVCLGPRHLWNSPPPGSPFPPQLCRLEGSLLYGLPVCCPGTPACGARMSQCPRAGTLIKQLKTAITPPPDLVSRPGSRPAPPIAPGLQLCVGPAVPTAAPPDPTMNLLAFIPNHSWRKAPRVETCVVLRLAMQVFIF